MTKPRKSLEYILLRIGFVAILLRFVLVSSSTSMSTSIDDVISIYGGQDEEEHIEIFHNEIQENQTRDILLASNTSLGMEDEEVYPENTRKRKQFLHHVAKVSSMLLRREKDATLIGETEEMHEEKDATTHQSDLTRPGRYVHIVTTAAIPWFTGTAINPLLRSAYLHDRLKQINNDNNNNGNSTESQTSWVTLVIPWLELEDDQRQVYNGQVFQSPGEQEQYVRNWLRDQAYMPDAAQNLNIVFYNARYHAGLGSIFAMGDIIQELPEDELDVCILEEPEHINWFRAPGQGWTKRYNYVVGIVHTNYDQYATQHYSGLWTAPAIRVMSAAMIRAYCHKVIKLSDVLQPFAPEKETTVNVHGVRQEFIQTMPIRNESHINEKTSNQTYFIGKLLWTKGLDVLLELQDYYKEVTGDYFEIDIYGSGPDQDEILRAYLGRRSQQKKTKSIDNPKNFFVKLFTWANRRRKRKGASLEKISKDLRTLMDAWPTKAKESMETLPIKVREAMEQLSEDLSNAKDSIESLPAKARETFEQLAVDLSNVKTKLGASTVPRSFYELRRQPIPARFPGRVDHATLKQADHKIFVNPSLSEVLCTTTAEALAMGKFAIVPVHPSNAFFLKFPNCLGYRNAYEFVANLQWALSHDPVTLTEELAREFTWVAATDRLLEAAAITHQEAQKREQLGKSKIDERIAWFHNQIGKGVKGDVIRKVFGAGPASNQVKYVKKQQEKEIQAEDEEEEGLSKKFRDSVLVQAIRQANSITVNG